jgi:hypothetical protein
MSITIGADPEFLLYQYREEEYDEYEDSYSESEYIPCVGIVPGTKEEPHPLNDAGIFCHEDNVAVELRIPACVTPGDFRDQLMLAKTLLYEQFLRDEGYELTYISSREFPARQLQSDQAKAFGCEPDFDAYTNGKARSVPLEVTTGNTRFAGGHVHIGGQFNCPPFVAALFADIFIGVGMILNFTQYHDNDTGARKLWYGRPGIFRPKPYGIEYRTPSNWWLRSEQYMLQMGHQAIHLGRYLENTSAIDLRSAVGQIPWLDVQDFLQYTPGNQEEREEKVRLLASVLENIMGTSISRTRTSS